MTDPYHPPGSLDIAFTGQRMHPSAHRFPARSDQPGEQMTEEPAPTGVDGPTSYDRCNDASQKTNWNADAMAGQAKAAFEARAAELGDDGLFEREFGAAIYADANGNTWLGTISWGDTMGGTVGIDFSAATPTTLIGFIHSHPSSSYFSPSGPDWSVVWDSMVGWVSQNGGDASRFRQYMVARDTSDPNSEFGIKVFDASSSRDNGAWGPDVNPSAAPCSS